MTLSSLRLVTWSLRHSVTWSLRHFVTFHLCLWLLGAASAGAQVASWSRTYGGTSRDEAHAIAPTPDGGYIVAGGTLSFGAGYRDVWVLKLDGSGNVVWQKTYGGTGGDWAYAIIPTSDGGYVVAGYTESFGAGYSDVWVLKLDGSGNVQWQKTYGGTDDDWANAVVPTSDGGYIVAGATCSFGTAGACDFWVLRLDGSGNVMWQKTYGGAGYDYAFAIAPTPDGGYIVAGATWSFGADNGDVWVLKLDGQGNVVWQKTYGGTNSEVGVIVPTSDGGYVVAGDTNSFGAGSFDAWVLRLDGSGNVVWQKTYGGTQWDRALAIVPTSDGGYVVAGYTNSFGAGLSDAWVLRLDGQGNVVWQKTYGGTQWDRAFAIVPTSDGGYVVAGYTESFGAGGEDVWVLKLEADGTVRGCPSGLVRDSAASVGPTSVSPGNSSAVGQTTSASAVASSAVVGTSSASSAGVCSGLGDEPVAGDWNGDGKTDAGVVHDWGWGLGWYLDANGNGAWDGCGVDRCFFFGGAGSKPVAGDWNGDGKTDAGVVYDWGWGLGWYLDANGNGAWDGCGVDRCFFFGGAGSKPVAGDWNGDGKTDAGVVYDWGWGLGWYLDANGNGAWDGCGVDRCFFFANAAYRPVVGDWNGAGPEDFGAYYPPWAGWYLDGNGNGVWEGCSVDRCFFFGSPWDRAVVGDWNGDGRTDVGFIHNWGWGWGWYLDGNGNGVWEGCSVDRCFFFGKP